MVANTPDPPYYAVIFTSRRTAVDEGYGAMADRMVELAKEQPGYLGIESFRNADGYGVAISYWASPEAIRDWKKELAHRQAQQLGREQWYEAYRMRICRVEPAIIGSVGPISTTAGLALSRRAPGAVAVAGHFRRHCRRSALVTLNRPAPTGTS